MAGSYSESMNTLLRREVRAFLADTRQSVRADLAQAEPEPDLLAKIKANKQGRLVD